MVYSSVPRPPPTARSPSKAAGTYKANVSSVGNGNTTTTGTALVTGPGTTWVDSANINVGNNGSAGTLSIANGGSASCWIVNLGWGSGTVGTVNVSGEGSLLTVLTLIRLWTPRSS
jgi:T5SS/PEP-CTERM-associated repeat protein